MATEKDEELPLLIPVSSLADFTECPVCMCHIISATITTCGHRFCEKCIHQWVSQQSRCPCCNEALTTAQLIKDRQYDSLIDTLEKEKHKAEAKFMQSKTSDPTVSALLDPEGTRGVTCPSTSGTDNYWPDYQISNRNVIWKGELEWQDKFVQGQKITRNLPCTVSIRHTDREMNTSNWPRKLFLQLMPQVLLNTNQFRVLLRKSRLVTFHFQEDLISADVRGRLYRYLSNGFAACVHFPSHSPCNLRLLLLLYSNKRQSFLGIIPNDQNGVVNGVKQVILEKKASLIRKQ